MEDWESDKIVETWLKENDPTIMPLPSIDSKPHLLISKVRKHYMEYLIKLLTDNYENHQKLLNKNLYLPSAIWRCAKIIEMSATQASMVVQLYRENIHAVVKELKNTTNKGFLYKKLYECLHYSPENEKKTQASLGKFKECNCQCSCNQKKKFKKNLQITKRVNLKKNNNNTVQNTNIAPNLATLPIGLSQNNLNITQNNVNSISSPQVKDQNMQVSMELPNSDDLMQQLEKLFQADPNEDDLFDGAFCTAEESNVTEENTNLDTEQQINISQNQEIANSQKPCLDDRLSMISGLLINNESTIDTSAKRKTKISKRPTKWLCEEYFQKVKLFELLDQIRDRDRNKLARIKKMLIDLFGEDSDDEGVVSPLDDNPEFVYSCKERISPWVVKILTPYYVNGRIRGKTLFKSLAKHLIRLIYQCSKYPHEYEVHSFINDFLDTHKMIRCEADFKEFRIENV